MLDHVFLSVSDIERSIAFYTQALAPLGITDRVDYDGKDGPPGHPDLKGFGCKGLFFLWPRQYYFNDMFGLDTGINAKRMGRS
jgi:catechol 2,3-dioxygenase-like lactoylglutathione lyase family enzyme